MLMAMLLASTVEITMHHYHVVTPPKLSIMCGSSPWLRGCTFFVGRKLIASCKQTGDVWRPGAAAKFGLISYVSSRNVIAHEIAHVTEVQRDVEAYVAQLAAEKFSTYESCVQRVQEEEAAFGEVMDVMQWHSNNRHHPFVVLPPSVARTIDSRPALLR